MVDFIRRRLQVFVSSTYEDLIPERQAAVEAILTAGHVPAGMELFAAGDESQMDVIKQWIDESDVYLLILGGRYGSVEPASGKSYTQLEYEYAVAQGKPLFACVLTDAAHEARVKEHGTKVLEQHDPQGLAAFRADVLTRLVKFWDDAKDIRIAIGQTLSTFARRDDLVGWVRASEGASPALAEEIARLSRENAELREALGSRDVKIQGLSFGELKEIARARGLLGYLREHGGDVRAGVIGDDDVAGQLVEAGIIDETWDAQHRHRRLTELGRSFLNRLEFENLAEGAEAAGANTGDGEATE